MESEQQQNDDLLGTVVRPPSIRVSGSFKSTLSGRLTPRSSPSFRRSPSIRTPSARDTRFYPQPPLPWYRKGISRRLVPWLIVICLWAYIGLLLQSRWAHNDGQGSILSQLKADEATISRIVLEQEPRAGHDKFSEKTASDVRVTETRVNGEQATEFHMATETNSKKPSKVVPDSSEVAHAKKLSPNIDSWIFPSIGTVNTSIGSLVGPFDDLERSILGSTSSKKLSSCSRGGAFAKFVKGKSFMLVFHELSMTGSPLAMLELAIETLSCGGKVLVVTLSQKGGLMQELVDMKIKILRSKAVPTFKAAAGVDFVVAGSAVCASWIEKCVTLNKKGSVKIIWWIMENRKEYFDRSKHMLGLSQALIFLSESQLEQWKVWSELEGILLPDKIAIVPLCVNEELSSKAGLCNRNTSIVTSMQELRVHVRKEMGIRPHDVLFTTLSSINPGKGQLKLLQAVAMVLEEFEGSLLLDQHLDHHMAAIQLHAGGSGYKSEEGRLRLLVGSVGSKSNKVDYVQKLLEFVQDHPRLAGSILWTPVTVHVASLYAASDVYVINSQGIGETFGRVTVEAMAFSLPILGTDAGGTSELVENNKSGLLHPVGADGIHTLAQHIKVLLQNATIRHDMGATGKDKVRKMYLKEQMYDRLAAIFSVI